MRFSPHDSSMTLTPEESRDKMLAHIARCAKHYNATITPPDNLPRSDETWTWSTESLSEEETGNGAPPVPCEIDSTGGEWG